MDTYIIESLVLAFLRLKPKCLSRSLLLLLSFLLITSVHLQAQYSESSTRRFFERIKPNFPYYNLTEFHQSLLDEAHSNQYLDLTPVDSLVGLRLFSESRLLQPGMPGIYYYAFNPTYGEFYQIVFCITGAYAPMLLLMNYSPYGELLAEINIAGNFIDGGEAFFWNTKLPNRASIAYQYNSYYQGEDRVFYCDSTLRTYVQYQHGAYKLLTESHYLLTTHAARGNTTGLVEEQHKRSRVFAPSGLKMKADYRKKAPKIGVIPYGAELDILEVSEEPFDIDWIRGNWVKVQYDTLQGYVFDGYLSTLIPPDLSLIEPCEKNYSILLRDYTEQHFTPISAQDTLINMTETNEEYFLQLVQFYQDSIKLTINKYWEGNSTELEIPESSVEEMYILVSALLSSCSDTEDLKKGLLFVKNRKKEIYKIYDRSGLVEIRQVKGSRIRLTMNYQCCGVEEEDSSNAYKE